MSALHLRNHALIESATLGSSEAREEVIVADGMYEDMYERISAALDAVVETPINNPPHYVLRDGSQSMDFIAATLTPEEFRGYLRGNAIKYLVRFDKKGTPEKDMLKALDYVQRLKQVVDGQVTDA